MIAAGWTQDVRDTLAEAGIESVLFKDISPNPRDHEVMAGAALFARERCDVIVAVGGGSAIDCAKAIGRPCQRLRHPRDGGRRSGRNAGAAADLHPDHGRGTAADISQFCIIVNSPERYKMATQRSCLTWRWSIRNAR